MKRKEIRIESDICIVGQFQIQNRSMDHLGNPREIGPFIHPL